MVTWYKGSLFHRDSRRISTDGRKFDALVKYQAMVDCIHYTTTLLSAILCQRPSRRFSETKSPLTNPLYLGPLAGYWE
jgi:hypothetical protein